MCSTSPGSELHLGAALDRSAASFARGSGFLVDDCSTVDHGDVAGREKHDVRFLLVPFRLPGAFAVCHHESAIAFGRQHFVSRPSERRASSPAPSPFGRCQSTSTRARRQYPPPCAAKARATTTAITIRIIHSLLGVKSAVKNSVFSELRSMLSATGRTACAVL